jgi:hypothetical protein
LGPSHGRHGIYWDVFVGRAGIAALRPPGEGRNAAINSKSRWLETVGWMLHTLSHDQAPMEAHESCVLQQVDRKEERKSTTSGQSVRKKKNL